jgi:aquaporin Z
VTDAVRNLRLGTQGEIVNSNLMKRSAAELVGTFWLVLGGCGAAVLAAKIPFLGIGYAGVALAFGLAVLTGAYAFGAISGAHFNPAITVGVAVARRFPSREVLPYIVAQLAGAILGAVTLLLIARGSVGFSLREGFATNGYGDHSPGGYNLGAALLLEIVMTFMFVMVVLGVTDKRSPSLKPFAPIAIGLALTAIHLVSIPVTNASVNPARSTGPALLVGGWAIGQLWLFWVAPLLGGAIAGALYPRLATVTVEGTVEGDQLERGKPAPIDVTPQGVFPAPAH